VPATGTALDPVSAGAGQRVGRRASRGRHATPPIVSAMFVSRDGGLNYQEAFAASDENPFVSMNPLGDAHVRAGVFPHPSDSDVVYLAYTSRADETSYLYRYDAALDQLTRRSWPSAEGGVSALTFNPADADLIYLGLSAAE
jgi:hypothetical protein